MYKILTLAVLATASALSGNAALAQAVGSGMPNLPAGVPAAPAPGSGQALTVLYDQTDSAPGVGALTMNFLDTGFDIYDSEAADDFTVPAGQVWLVQAIDAHYKWVAGILPNPQATNLAMNVTIYRGARPNGLPGVAIAHFQDIPVNVDASSGYAAIELPSAVRLRPGTYWVSVQLNLTYLDYFGYWTWSSRSSQSGRPAAWRNPGGGWDANCMTWHRSTDCLYGSRPGDHVFTLRGTVF